MSYSCELLRMKQKEKMKELKKEGYYYSEILNTDPA